MVVNSVKARLSVVVQGIETGSSSLLDEKGELHAYYHTDYLGTTDYLTSAVNSKVVSWTSYVVMQDGILNSLDNRRLFAAKRINTGVQANIHTFDSALSATEISRFTVGKIVTTTWEKQHSSEFKISLVNIPQTTLTGHILSDGMENRK